MREFLCVVFFTVASAHLPFNHADKLQPVQSLYVKPSADGATGDLYVAATEDNGISKWLTDYPVNFLPALTQQAVSPSTISAAIANAPHDESGITQKRAVISQGATYNFGTPFAVDEKHIPLPYAATISAIPKDSKDAQSAEVTSQPQTQALPQYLPYQYLYPTLAASTTTISQNIDAKENKEASATQTPYWPSAYSYSTYPYMMMDPRFWAWAQAAGAINQQAATPTTEASAEEIKE